MKSYFLTEAKEVSITTPEVEVEKSGQKKIENILYKTTTEIDETATETTFKYPNSGIIIPFIEDFKPIFTEEQNSEVEYIHILPNNNNTTTTEIMVETTEIISTNPNTNSGEPDENVQNTATNLEIQTTEDIPEIITTSVITNKDVDDDDTTIATTTDSLAEEELEGISVAPATSIDFMEIMEY